MTNNTNEKIQEFRQGSLSVVAPKLANTFSALAGVTSLNARDVERVILDAPGEAARNTENEILMSNGSIEGVMERGQNLAKSHAQRAQRDSDARKKTSDLVNFLSMLNSGELPGYIADQVFDGMSDDEITALVADIEEQTGRPFEAYARDILGDDLPDRIESESEADYQRRVLKAVTEEMLNPDGTVKPEYADDPVAQFLEGQEIVQEVRQKAQSTQAEVEISGVTPELENKARELAEPGYVAADTTGFVLKDNTLETVATDGQDIHCDDDSDVAQNEDRSVGGLSMMPGFSAAASGEEIQTASTTLVDQPSTLPNPNDPSPI